MSDDETYVYDSDGEDKEEEDASDGPAAARNGMTAFLALTDASIREVGNATTPSVNSSPFFFCKLA
jgi:hypothetical protein